MAVAAGRGTPKAGALDSWIVSRAVSLGYSNARVKAMKETLLQQKDISAMAEAGGVGEIYALLEKTGYRQDLVAGALKDRTLADHVEFACAKNFSRTLAKIIRISPKGLGAKIMQMFEKYEVDNIKAILLGKHLGGESIALVETGIIPAPARARMLDAKSVKEAVAALAGTPYAPVLEKAMREYEKERDISALLHALDSYYYSRLPEIAHNPYGDEKVILGMLRAQVDAKNVSTALRAVKEGMKEEAAMALMAHGGKIGRDRLRQALGAKSAEEAMRQFEKEFGLGKAIEAHRKNGTLIPAEIEAEKAVARKGLSLLRTSVLSIGAIAGFLFLKEQEVANIRKIVRAKEFGLGAEKAKEMLVMV